MAFAHGKDSVVKLDNEAGTLTDISAYIDNFEFDRMRDIPESSTMGDQAKEYAVPGLRDAKFTMSGKYDPATGAIDDILGAAFDDSATRTVDWSPAGTTTGRPKFSGESWITSYKVTGNIGGLVTFQAEGQVTGDVTRGTN